MLAFSFAEGEAVVGFAGCGAGLVVEFIAVDGDDLVELGVGGDAFHVGQGFQGVHFGTADRDDINGTGGWTLGGDAGGHVFVGPQATAGVGVIVALQDQVDFEPVKDRLPEISQVRVVPVGAGRIDWKVEGDDGPQVLIVA